jgi:hypothetical protein
LAYPAARLLLRQSDALANGNESTTLDLFPNRTERNLQEMNAVQFDRTMADEAIVRERLKPLVTQERINEAASRLGDKAERHLLPYMHPLSRMNPNWVIRHIVQRNGAEESAKLADDCVVLDKMIDAAIVAASEVSYEIICEYRG